jgi:VWFA-related protein
MNRRSLAGFSATVLVCALNHPTGAAEPGEVRIRYAPYRPPSAVISVETNLVELGVTVRDRKGAPIGGLQASDFQVFDNLKPQIVTSFSERRAEPALARGAAAGFSNPLLSAIPPAGAVVAAAPPRTIALFFDDTHSGLAGFDRSKHAAQKMIADGLGPGDRVGIFTGSGAVTLDFTADTKTLLATLAGMRRHPDAGSNRGYGVCPTLTAYQAYVIAKHLDGMAKMVAVADLRTCEPTIPEEVAEVQAQDAAETAWDLLRNQSSKVLDMLAPVVRHLAAAPGTRILLMVSPGFVTDGMDRQLGGLADVCLRAHIVVNALDDEGLLSGGRDSPESLGSQGGPRVAWAERTLAQRTQAVTGFLADAAAATGGRFIHNSNDLPGGLRTLAAAPEVSYLLGFSPSAKPDGKYHKLKVTTSKPGGYRVSARPGYFAALPSERSETAQQRIDRVFASGQLLSQVPAAVRVGAVDRRDGRYTIEVNITLDAKRLPFTARNGRSLQELTFVTVLEDAAGNYLQGKQAVMDMALTAATRADLETRGIKAVTSFLAGKGSYRIREVIREAVRNRLTASNSPVELR